MSPACWKCGSTNVTVTFTGFQPTYHKRGECESTCVNGQPCGQGKTGRLTCRTCGNTWTDGAIDEFEVAAAS
jgi:hypothetical protein